MFVKFDPFEYLFRFDFPHVLFVFFFLPSPPTPMTTPTDTATPTTLSFVIVESILNLMLRTHLSRRLTFFRHNFIDRYGTMLVVNLWLNLIDILRLLVYQ